MPRSVLRPILIATFVAGTLDILAAIGLTLYFGTRSVADMLRFVASGPFPSAIEWGTGGAALGLAVHFTLMAIMVAAYILVAARQPAPRARPVLWGAVFGLVTYVVMNLIVVRLRFGGPFPPSTRAIVTQLFCHVALVGLPTALIAARCLRARPFAS